MPNANWANPTLASTYTNFVTEVKARDEDLALQFDGTTATAFPIGTIRWSSSVNRWQKWSGAAWGELATTYALTGLSTTGAAAIAGNLTVTGTSAFTGIPTAPTAATGTNTTQLATTAHVFATAALLAPLASPTFTGNVTLPTLATITGASTPVLRINSTASGTWKSFLTFANAGTSKWEIGVDQGAAGNNNLYFYDNAAGFERARFTPFGYLKCSPFGSYQNVTASGTYHEFHSTSQPLILRNVNAAAGKWWYVGPDNLNNGFTIYNQTNTTGVFIADGATAWSATSDERVKDIIEPISNALSKVGTLRAVIGKFKTDPVGTRRSFLIAQDVQAVLPEAVNVQADAIETLGLAYTDVIPLLTAALKESLVRIEALEAQVTTLQAA